MQHNHILTYNARKCLLRVALWQYKLHQQQQHDCGRHGVHSWRTELSTSCSNIRMQIISSTSIRLYVNAITYIAMALFTKHTFFLWIFALFIMDSSQWDKLSVLVFIFHLSVCPILETSIFMLHPSSKTVRDISIFWKTLLFTPLEVVTTVYLQLPEDIAFLYKLEMP